MATFKYVGKGKDGRDRRGTVEAASEERAVEVLREQGITVVSLAAERSGINFDEFLKRIRRPTDKEKAVFTRQLATMVGAGLPLAQALSILRDQAGNTQFGDVLEYVLGEVQGGKSLSESMRKFPSVFSETYVSLVEAAEASGAMKKVLERLAENLEKRGRLKSSIKSALLYPALILCAMLGVGTLLIVFVIPKLKEMYMNFNAELPLLTRIFLGLSDFVIGYWWVAILLVIGIVVGFKKFTQTRSGKYILAKIIFRLPIFGQLYKEIQLVEITRTLSLLLSSGVPIIDALNITKGSTGNVVYQDVLATAAAQVERGETLASPFRSSQYFPPIVSRMLSVGEESGETGEILLRLATYFEDEAQHKIDNLTTALEPLIMIVLGAGVGFMVLSIIMPIYNLTGQF